MSSQAESLETSKWLGIALALVANSITAVSFNVQRYAHMQNDQLPEPKRKPYYALPVWWTGLILLVVGEAGNFIAYSFAPASLIAPLGAWTVIMNGILATSLPFLKERLSPRDIIGYFLTIGGGLLIIVFAPPAQGELDPERFMVLVSSPLFVAYITMLCIAIGFFIIIGVKYGDRSILIYLLITSMLGSITIMATKGFSTFLREQVAGKDTFGHAVTYVLFFVMVVTAIAQVQYLNLCIRDFGTAQVIPVFFVLFTFFTISGSAMLYQEFASYVKVMYNAIMFLVGIMIIFIAMLVIASGAKNARGGRIMSAKALIGGSSSGSSSSNSSEYFYDDDDEERDSDFDDLVVVNDDINAAIGDRKLATELRPLTGGRKSEH